MRWHQTPGKKCHSPFPRLCVEDKHRVTPRKLQSAPSVTSVFSALCLLFPIPRLCCRNAGSTLSLMCLIFCKCNFRRADGQQKNAAWQVVSIEVGSRPRNSARLSQIPKEGGSRTFRLIRFCVKTHQDNFHWLRRYAIFL